MNTSSLAPGQLVGREQLAASLAHCRRVTRQRARNFYYGLKLTPEPKRSALYAVYAFMRACDDLADAADASYGSQAALDRIETYRDHMASTLDNPPGDPLPPDPVWPALRYVCDHWPIDATHLHAMLDGQKCDIERNRYASFDELRDYCHNVASVVGLVCISVWGHDGDPRVRQMAQARGIALQLTNILRDLVEDARRDRIYLPIDEIERFGLDAPSFLQMVRRGEPDERFDRLMAHQLERAGEYYEQCAGFDQHISADCRATSLAILRIYRGLYDRIKSAPRRVLAERVRLSRLEKVLIGLGAAWRRK